MYLFFCAEHDFWEDHHKMVEDNWSVRKRSKLLEELDTGSLVPELAVYFKAPVLKLKDNPLTFYSDNYNYKNSVLVKVATKYLSVMATSVPSERVFSLAGGIVSEKKKST